MPSNTDYADLIVGEWCDDRLFLAALQAGSTEPRARMDVALDDDAEVDTMLLSALDPWLGARRLPVVICGLPQERSAMPRDIPTVPRKPLELTPRRLETRSEIVRVFGVPALRQERDVDLMSAELGALAGFLERRPDFDGVVCLTGRVSKWVHLSAGEVVSFQSGLSAQLFEALTGGGLDLNVARHEAEFADAVSDILSRPERLGQRLASLRATQILEPEQGEVVPDRFLGSLIGAEIAASRPYWLGQSVVIMSSSGIGEAYSLALKGQGLEAEILDRRAFAISGLSALYARIANGA